MILDVGCGGNPRGQVNTDRYFGITPHTGDIITKCENFIKSDVYYLPFPDESFDIVHSAHLIEHLEDPVRALKELRRVSRKVVYLKVPWALSLIKQRKEHLFAWDRSTFENFLSLFFFRVNVYLRPWDETRFHGRRFNRLGLLRVFILFLEKIFLTFEIIAVCHK